MEEKLSEAGARDILGKPHLILTAEFAAEVNRVGQHLKPGQLLYPLVAPWYVRSVPEDISRIYDDWRAHKIKVSIPKDWRELMEGMDDKKRSHLGRLLENLMWAGARTIEDALRMAADKGIHRGVGNTVGKPFALLAFARPKAQEQSRDAFRISVC